MNPPRHRPSWARRDPGPAIAAAIAGIFAALVLAGAVLAIVLNHGGGL